MARRSVFFGWYLIGYLLFVQVLTVGFLFYGFGVLLDPVAATLHLSRGETAYGFSLFTFGVAVWSPLLGVLVERHGARLPMLSGLVILPAGLLALGIVTSATAYYAVMGLWLSLGVTAAAGVPAQTLVVNWFRRHRGMALSLTSAGVSLGGLLMAPLVGWLIPLVGWTRAILLPAALLALALPVGWRLVRNRPEDLGLFRDGDPQDVAEPPALLRPLAWRALLGDKRFRIVAVAYGLALACMTSLMVNLVSYWTDLGLSHQSATVAFALLAGVGMVGKPFFGRLADRIDARVGAMASFGLLLGGTLLLLIPSPWAVVPFVIVFGLGIGGAVPMQGAINGALYGREQFARIAGVLTPWIVGVQAAFYGITGYALDYFHAYPPLFVGFALLLAASLVLLSRLELPPPEHLTTTV